MKTLKILGVLLLSLTVINCSTDKKENAVVNDPVVVTETIVEEMITPESLAENMHMYVIEREIPGLGDWSTEDLKGASQTSCGVLKEMGSDIQWLHSYVTGDKMYCVYLAPNEEMVREHAVKGGFPANSVSAVTTIISPDTAELD